MSLLKLSPSNLTVFRQCPLKFWGQRAGLIMWKDSPAKARGTAVHECLETAVSKGVQEVTVWPENMDVGYVHKVLGTIDQQKQLPGMQCYTEHEMAVDQNFKKREWRDDDVFLRAKADLLLVTPGSTALIGDWKTGKIYPGMDFQLRVEAILVHVLYQVPFMSWALFYVDQGRTKTGTVDFRQGLAPVDDILQLMRDCYTRSNQGGVFTAKKNQFCRWCDFYHTPYCSDSKEW